MYGTRRFSTNETDSCVSCHTNSLVANTGVSYAVGYSSANTANASHYSTKTSLLKTTDETNCKLCHANNASGYGAPIQIVVGTHGFGISSCQESCHSTVWQTSSNVSLHNSSIGIFADTASCYNSDAACHTPLAY